MADIKSIINSFTHTQSNAFLLYKNETCPILSTRFKCPSIEQQIIAQSHLRPVSLFVLQIQCCLSQQLLVQPILLDTSRRRRPKPHLIGLLCHLHHTILLTSFSDMSQTQETPVRVLGMNLTMQREKTESQRPLKIIWIQVNIQYCIFWKEKNKFTHFKYSRKVNWKKRCQTHT